MCSVLCFYNQNIRRSTSDPRRFSRLCDHFNLVTFPLFSTLCARLVLRSLRKYLPRGTTVWMEALRDHSMTRAVVASGLWGFALGVRGVRVIWMAVAALCIQKHILRRAKSMGVYIRQMSVTDLPHHTRPRPHSAEVNLE